MNINQAKNYIKNDVRLYLKKNEYGEYRIPLVRQRPIFLLGAPGIGKTAIMEQVAEELQVALVSYSMTHHTRQSALGLPFIRHKEYEGMEYDVSEYTMSEIIASIYDVMEQSGVKEGILFLDEINCVSETLAPSMLQFLQYKVFGRHKVPEGWVIVTAGNPPEYNKSVREFDVVTMDRLKILEVEADYKTWKKYAAERGIHTAILNFLEIKKDYFYHMEMTVGGRSYVTARGWEDLSLMITLYEEEELTVDETLVSQYIRNEKIVKEFTAYYDLYKKYKKDYQLEQILCGEASEAAIMKGQNATFDERLSVLGMLMDQINVEMKQVMEESDYLTELMGPCKAVKNAAQDHTASDIATMLNTQQQGRKTLIEQRSRANSLSREEKEKQRRVIAFLEANEKAVRTKGAKTGEEAFAVIKEAFDQGVLHLKEHTENVQKRLHHLFTYVAAAFSNGNEMLLLTTELTVNTYSSRFISRYGSEDYKKASDELMLSERQNDLLEQIKELQL
ncbi:MAG: AAA family ATPase [Lachnospiraceae bacterium]|nr:AAA family ATPase [Lachnospiraceae bacterium]